MGAIARHSGVGVVVPLQWCLAANAPYREAALDAGHCAPHNPQSPRMFKHKLVRNLATAQMNDLQAAVFKATTEDGLPPKEKHVMFVLRAAAEPEQQAEVASHLVKRLQSCRSAKTAVVAAKTLVPRSQRGTKRPAGPPLPTAQPACSARDPSRPGDSGESSAGRGLGRPMTRRARTQTTTSGCT